MEVNSALQGPLGGVVPQAFSDLVIGEQSLLPEPAIQSALALLEYYPLQC